MPVIDNSKIQQFTLPGLVHQTLASHNDGLKGTEVWMQTIEPGGETPIHYHDCEEVVVVIKGSGQLTIGEDVTAFSSNHTLIIPPEVVHQLINSGNAEIFLLATFSSTPTNIFTPEGEKLPLPWQS
jgi:quercetin dioxygenase-like cupin family protein